MIYINSNPHKTATVARQWLDWLIKHIEESDAKQAMISSLDSNSDLTQVDRELGKRIIDDFYGCLDYYVLADESAMNLIRSTYENYHVKKNSHLHKILKENFNNLYTSFTQYIPDGDKDVAYRTMEALNIRTCPYCNRSYTFTLHSTSQKTRPEFDHFYHKASNPLLAVSFYNLIPSCHTCNHLKFIKSIGINPYFRGFNCKMRATKENSGIPLFAQRLRKDEHLIIKFDNPSDAESQNIQKLGLDKLYQMHEDYVRELVEKAQIYRGPMKGALASAFQTPDYSPDQVYDFVWGKNLDTANHINRPLSKLTRDILEELDISVNDIED